MNQIVQHCEPNCTRLKTIMSLKSHYLPGFLNRGMAKKMGQLKTLGTQMDYPIGVPIWVLQENKSFRIIDNAVKVIQN